MTRYAPPEIPDSSLLRQCDRRPQAFATLYQRHVLRVHNHLLGRTSDEHAARDLTAETFARAWIGRKKFRDEAGGSALPWLLGIAHYVLLESVRKQRMERKARERLGMLERLDSRPDDITPSETWDTDIDALLSALPATQREVLKLRFVDDRDYGDVAELLNTTEANARVRVHRALRSLRAHLSTSSGTPR